MEKYAAAKAKLFGGVGAPPPRVAVINLDDSYAGLMEDAAAVCGVRWTFGIKEIYGWVPEYKAENIVVGADRTSFEWKTPAGAVDLESPLLGWVNVSNLLAASCAALACGLTLDQIKEATCHLTQVPGRFQVVPGSAEAGFTVVVDYAHTDDALRNLIALGRELVAERGGRVITMFGCGGDRDRTKRPRMGRAAAENSDLVVLTSDNPRGEDPMEIIAEALAGVRKTTTECIVEPDRAAAIRIAIRAARTGDIVLLAGKGHEKVQVLRDRTIPFDDVSVAENILKELR
jgi:UDP-N-acetylmuramoyl-L-alanyl-D-glutamate--2,6-diaminopimelate ligase